MSKLAEISEALTKQARAIHNIPAKYDLVLGWYYDDPQDDYPNIDDHSEFLENSDRAALNVIRDTVSEMALALTRLEREIKERFMVEYEKYPTLYPRVRHEIGLEPKEE